MTDIRKDLKGCPFCKSRAEQFVCGDGLMATCPNLTCPASTIRTSIDIWNTRAHDVDGVIAELVKQSGAFRDSENSGMIDIQRVISIIRKRFGKE